MFESKRIVNDVTRGVRLGGKILSFWGGIISEIGKESVDENSKHGEGVSAQHGPSFSLITINLAPNVAPSLVLNEQTEDLEDDSDVGEVQQHTLPEQIVIAAFTIPRRAFAISNRAVHIIRDSEQHNDS